jgi:hypothetical protein
VLTWAKLVRTRATVPSCVLIGVLAICGFPVDMNSIFLVVIPERNSRKGRKTRIIDSSVERLDSHRVRVTTTIELGADEGSEVVYPIDLGEGPTGDAIPDKIVRCLIDRGPGSVTLAELQNHVGGNPSTVNRQAWTLASNAPDLQRRLRGWVMHVERGRYALSPAARLRLGL